MSDNIREWDSSQPDVTGDERLRYSRHLMLPEVGMAGQRRIKAARVLCVGIGGLGSPAAMYLAAAGVGTLGLVDFDTVDLTNLQRQILYSTGAVGRKKLYAARETLQSLNPEVRVETHEAILQASNAMSIIGSYDVIVDGADNFSCRYVVNDACVLLGKPNIHGSVLRFEGMASVFDARVGPCYRCLYPEPPEPGQVPSCAQAGVLGVLPGLIGLLQATETLKVILGVGQTLVGRLLRYDAMRMRFSEVKLRKDPKCPVCGASPTISEPVDYPELCGSFAVEEMVGMMPDIDITPVDVKVRLERGEPLMLVDVRQPDEWELYSIEGAVLIPLSELAERYGEVPKDRDVIVYCRSGMRSARAVKFLHEQGHTRVRNMVGGILGWSRSVDPSVMEY